MKTKLLAALIGTCFALPALAQTNLTIYGIVDAGVQVSRFGNGTQTDLASGIAEGSRLGFKGTEDLGGGYKAVFNLEARLELDNGGNRAGYIGKYPNFALVSGAPAPAPVSAALASSLGANNAIINADGALFDRTALVGMITPVGAFLLGRQYTPAYEVFNNADTFESGSVGTWGNIGAGTSSFYTPGVAIRASNALQYRIQLPNGIAASLMYSPEAVGSGSLGLSDRFFGANLRYEANGFNVGIGHNRENNTTGAKSLQTSVIGGSYDTGTMKFFAGYTKIKNDNPGIGTALAPSIAAALGTTGAPLLPGVIATINRNARIDLDSLSLGMHYRIGSGRIMGTVARNKNDLSPDSDVTLFALGYDHFLSKRTDVYVFLARANNEANAQYALGGAGYPGGFTTRGGQDASAVQIGIRHRF